ncbi:MAG: FAD-dependent oxidoreductase, partial [Cyanobacteria bacterium J06560_2]
LSSFGVGMLLALGFPAPLWGSLLGQSLGQSLGSAAMAQQSSSQESCPAVDDARQYDVVVFGDEIPGVMTALKVRSELVARGESAQVALVTEGNTANGIGGHLVRGGLAYLDRNQVPQRLRSQYGTFGRPSPLYQRFLRLGKVDTIALDREVAAGNLRRSLRLANIEVVGNANLGSVQTAGAVVCSFEAGGQTYSAQHFVDASQSGELAAASGVGMTQGLEALGFPDSALSIGLMVDLYGVTVDQFKGMEAELIQRYFNPRDTSAQRWLDVASGGDGQKRQELLLSLLDYYRQPKLLYQGTADSADVRSLAFSILVHGYVGQEYDLKSSGFLFDRANIAVLGDRLSFNALLFYADSTTAQQLSRSGSRPTEQMQAIAQEVKTLMERIGVPRVEIMPELYIRNAGQIANPLDELSATLMAAGGVPTNEALGTFGYHLDDRGGIEGLDDEVEDSVLRLFDFDHMPVFNYGFRHTLPEEKENLAVLGPASGFGGLGTTAGRIVEFNVSVGEGLAVAIAQAIEEDRSLHTVTNDEVLRARDYRPVVYGYRTDSYRAIASLERRFRGINYEQVYLTRAQAWIDEANYTEADRELSRALTLNPRNADAYYLRGVARAENGNVALAQADLERAIEIYQSEGNSSYALNVQGKLEALLN